MKRGGEIQQHVDGKLAVGSHLRRSGAYIIFYELRCADVIGIGKAGGGPLVTGGEFERSERNCLRNVRRNFEAGCHEVLVVAENETIKRRIQNKFDRYLESPLYAKTQLVTLQEILEGNNKS